MSIEPSSPPPPPPPTKPKGLAPLPGLILTKSPVNNVTGTGVTADALTGVTGTVGITSNTPLELTTGTGVTVTTGTDNRSATEIMTNSTGMGGTSTSSNLPNPSANNNLRRETASSAKPTSGSSVKKARKGKPAPPALTPEAFQVLEEAQSMIKSLTEQALSQNRGRAGGVSTSSNNNRGGVGAGGSDGFTSAIIDAADQHTITSPYESSTTALGQLFKLLTLEANQRAFSTLPYDVLTQLHEEVLGQAKRISEHLLESFAKDLHQPNYYEPKRWTRDMVQGLVSEEVKPSMYGFASRNNRRASALYQNPVAVEVVLLLGKHGPLTTQQLRTFLLANDDTTSFKRSATSADKGQEGQLQRLSSGLRFHLQQALQFCECQKIVEAGTIVGWDRGNYPLNVWVLTKAGAVWYQMLTNSDSTPGANPGDAYLLKHTYGIQQSLSAIQALCTANNALGTLDRIVSAIKQNYPVEVKATENPLTYSVLDDAIPELPALPLSDKDGTALRKFNRPASYRPTYRYRLEITQWGHQFVFIKGQGQASATNNVNNNSGTSKDKSKSNSAREASVKLIPDGIGQIIVDNRLAGSTLLKWANIQVNTKLLVPANFRRSKDAGNSEQLSWPFILEYDRGTETPQDFAAKYEGYSRLCNSYRQLWPDEWINGVFPVILVVTTGSEAHLRRLRLAVAEQLKKQPKNLEGKHQLITAWWFTRHEWLQAAYRPYLDEKQIDLWERNVLLSHSVSSKAGGRQPTTGLAPHIWIPLGEATTVEQLVAVSGYYDGRSKNAPAIMQKMCALPLPHPLNVQSPPV